MNDIDIITCYKMLNISHVHTHSITIAKVHYTEAKLNIIDVQVVYLSLLYT